MQIRRTIKRLCLFRKAFHHQVAINIPDYIKQQNRTTRQYHPRTFRNVQTSSNTYKYSFCPLTIKDWNSLPSKMWRHSRTDSRHIWQSNMQETLFLNCTCKYVLMSTILGNRTWNTCVMGLRPFAIQQCIWRCRCRTG